MKTRNTQAGFSLVELMVVVAIIGVLAVVAVPNYLKFQAKAKQSGAKVELSGLYTAQKATFVEYSSFSSNLGAAGYVPDGFASATNAATTAAPAALKLNRLYDVGVAGAVLPVPTSVAVNVTYAAYKNGLIQPYVAATTGAARALTATTFTASAAGDIGKGAGAGVEDYWTIDNDRTLTNTQPGY